MADKDGKFKVIKVTELSKLSVGEEIPESDVTFQTDNSIIQLEHIEKTENSKKYLIKPGCWSIDEGAFGPELKKFELKEYDLLDTIDNTSQIKDQMNRFFDRLHVYKRLKKPRDPKRALLIASPPGVGKTAAINDIAQTYLKIEGTAVIVWDTSGIKSSTVNKFFLGGSKFKSTVKKLVFIMEDVGGGSVEEYSGPKSVDSSLLQLLDGVGRPFGGIPTFIISTTNNPEQTVAPLIDRPGRFDKVIFLKPPNYDECSKLLSFLSNEPFDEMMAQTAKVASENGFSIAHLQEIVDRSLIDDISFLEAAEQLRVHKEKCKKNFQDTRNMGINTKW